MHIRLLYGLVKGGRLEEYEKPKQDLEALLAEVISNFQKLSKEMNVYLMR